MSWGYLFGAFFNTVAFGMCWIACGKFVEVIARAFNKSITIVPSFQDAVTGFTIQQYIWSGITVIVILAIWLNYYVNSNSPVNQEA